MSELIKNQHIGNQMLAMKMRNLYREDIDKFKDYAEYFSLSYYVNGRNVREYHDFSEHLYTKGCNVEKLFEKGFSYLKEISDQKSLEWTLIKTEQLNRSEDFLSICSYPQLMALDREPEVILTNKLILDSEKNISFLNFMSELGVIGEIMKELVPNLYRDREKWMLFQSLTKREKDIIQELATGKKLYDISDAMCVTESTLRTHKKNVYRKLGIHNSRELVRYALIMDLILD